MAWICIFAILTIVLFVLHVFSSLTILAGHRELSKVTEDMESNAVVSKIQEYTNPSDILQQKVGYYSSQILMDITILYMSCVLLLLFTPDKRYYIHFIWYP